MTHLDDISKHFLNHLRSDVDVSVGPGLPDHLDRLGDPALDAHWRSVDDARKLLAEIDDRGTGVRSLMFMRINPSYDFVRTDPRFVDLLTIVGLAE